MGYEPITLPLRHLAVVWFRKQKLCFTKIKRLNASKDRNDRVRQERKESPIFRSISDVLFRIHVPLKLTATAQRQPRGLRHTVDDDELDPNQASPTPASRRSRQDEPSSSRRSSIKRVYIPGPSDGPFHCRTSKVRSLLTTRGSDRSTVR
jgi:hypothetical protein